MSVRKQSFGIRHLTVVPTNFEPAVADESDAADDVETTDSEPAETA